jgi:hypothetical protein
MRDQVLRVENHDLRRGRVHALATLRPQFTDERLVEIGGGGVLASGARGGGGVQLSEQGMRYTAVLDRTALQELRGVALDALGCDNDFERHRTRSWIVHVVQGIHGERGVQMSEGFSDSSATEDKASPANARWRGIAFALTVVKTRYRLVSTTVTGVRVGT